MVVVSEVSHNTSVSVVFPVVSVVLDGDGVVSVGSRSDGSGSPVEDPPLLVVVWVVVLDSQSEVTVSDVLVPEEGSVLGHSSLDLESDSISEWVSWEGNTLSVKVELLVVSGLVAVTVSGVSTVSISSVNFEALSVWSSDLSNQVVEVVEGELLVGSGAEGVAVSSDDNVLVQSVVVVDSGDGVRWLPGRSDALSSSVEPEPLLGVSWLRSLGSHVPDITSSVLGNVEGSLVSSLVLDLESNSVTEWLSSVLGTSLIEEPSLVETVVAVPEDDVSVVSVGSTMDIKALSSVVLDVSVGTVVPSDLLSSQSSVWLDVGSNSNSELVSSLVGDGIVSLGPGSDGVGSGVEEEPLLHVHWIVSLDSESELVVTNVLVPEEGSVRGHS